MFAMPIGMMGHNAGGGGGGISYVNGAEMLSTSTNTTSYTSGNYTPSSTSNMLVLCIHGFSDLASSSPVVSSITYGGGDISTYQEILVASTSNRPWSAIYVFQAPNTSASAVVITMAANQRAMAISMMEFSGVDLVSPVTSTADSEANSTSASVSFTTSNNDAYLAGGLSLESGNRGPFTPTSPAVEVTDGSTGTTNFNDICFTALYRATGAAGSYAMETSWVASDDYKMSAVELKPA